jgi:hypothetical protein
MLKSGPVTTVIFTVTLDPRASFTVIVADPFATAVTVNVNGAEVLTVETVAIVVSLENTV